MRRPTIYTRIAIGLALIGIVCFVVSVLAYWLTLRGGGLSHDSANWGTFGDFVSGLAGTLIALATLVALALTLHLQAEELAKTSAALKEQAAASSEQLRLTREIELRRIRPLLKAEWVQLSHTNFELRMKNVGLGAAIVDRFSVFARNQHHGDVAKDDAQSRTIWNDALEFAMPPGHRLFLTVTTQPFSDLTRALAPGEYQWILRMDFGGVDGREFQRELETNLEPVIHFRSLAGQQLNTRVQFTLDPL